MEDKVEKRILSKRKIIRLKGMVIDGIRKKVKIGDIKILVLSVKGDKDDINKIKKWKGNINSIGGSKENEVR